MAEVAQVTPAVKHLRANEEKWGSTLIEAGWTLVPSTILERQQALGLTPLDLNILLQLARHWWQAGSPPHPSVRTIAECVGKSMSTVQRRITRLKKDGLIEIEHRANKLGGRTSSNYYFKGLIESATPYAEEAIEDRKQVKSNAAARRKRKGLLPRQNLKVVT